MSETAPERTPPKGKPGKKILGMDRTTVIVGAVALVGAAAYFLWKRKKSSTTQSSSASSSSAVDYSGQLSAIQSELESLLGQGSSSVGTGAGSGGGSGGGTGYPYGGQTGPSSSSVGTSTTPAGGSGSSTTPSTPAGGTSGGTTTTQPKTNAPPPAPASKPKPAMPSPRVTKVTSTSVGLSWPAVPGATSYTTRATYQGSLAKSYGGPQTSITIFGLTPDHTYTFHVAANGPGGSSAETNGPAQKTSK